MLDDEEYEVICDLSSNDQTSHDADLLHSFIARIRCVDRGACAHRYSPNARRDRAMVGLLPFPGKQNFERNQPPMTVGAPDRPPGDARTRGFPFIKTHSIQLFVGPIAITPPLHAGAGGARSRAPPAPA